MPACDKCYKSGRVPMPRCPEGKKVHDRVKEAHKKFENGEGTYKEWQDAWDEWVRHYRGRKKKSKQGQKQKGF